MQKGELTRRTALHELVEELNRIHPSGFFNTNLVKNESAMTDFVTAKNGAERHFAAIAKNKLQCLIYAWESEFSCIFNKVTKKTFENWLRQAVADLHAEGQFSSDPVANIVKLDNVILAILENIQTEFTHSFPVKTLGFEFNEPFSIGPVTFMTREHWINTVSFSDQATSKELANLEPHDEWRSTLLIALSRRSEAVEPDEEPLPRLALFLYGALRHCRSLLKISLSGYEYSLSTKAARNIGKTALDGVSLLAGGADFFHQQTLIDERMPPIETHTLIESKGFLWLPGMSTHLDKQIPILSGAKMKAFLEEKKSRSSIDALSHILTGLTSPATHPHPKLAMRWAMALDWLAEGEREVNEAIALAKIGTCLDVLTEGGKFGGILNLITHLTDWSEDKEFQIGAYPRSLRWLVKELYDHGRSKILHGNIF